MITLYDLLAGVLLPGGLALVICGAGWRLTRRRLGARRSRAALGPLAVGLAFAAGWLALFGRPGFPPLDATHWLGYLALPLVALGMLDSWLEAPGPLRLGLTVVAVPIAAWLVARPLLGNPSSDFGWVAWAFSSLLGIGWVLAMDQLAVHTSARRLGLLWLVAMIPASIALMLGGSLRLAQTSGLLVAALGGVVAAHLVMGASGVATGLPLVAGALYGGVLLSGALYADVGFANALLLFIAPLAAWLVRPLEPRWGAAWTALAQGPLILVPVAIALARLAMQFAERMNDY